MRVRNYAQCVIITKLVWWVFFSILLTVQNTNSKGTSMKFDCKNITLETSLGVEVVPTNESGKAAVVFVNKSSNSLWFPIEAEPTYRLDQDTGILYIWLGYFDEIYGEYAQKYMLPELRKVEPENDIKINLTAPKLAQIYLQHALKVQIQARISVVALEQSNVRGNQPLPEYLENSCIIKSPVIALEAQPAQ